MDFEILDQPLENMAWIKVVGVGGGGGNAVQNMIDSGLHGVSFVFANTDIQALNRGAVGCKLQLGERLTKGLGAGGEPAIGREAAMESVVAIKESLADADMVFVTAGMGGGTGTGAAPIIAQIAKEQGALTVGVVTKPFSFEGAKRKKAAEAGIAELRRHVDCLITIPNDRLLILAPKKALFAELLRQANDVLYNAVKGISDVIMAEGLINLDFADVRTAMGEAGLALMGTGIASGENRAFEAATRAINSPLLEDVSIEGAKAVLYNITAGRDVTAVEVSEIGTIIGDAVHPDANVLFGVVFDDNAGDDLHVTVIATGIEAPSKAGTGDQPTGVQPLLRNVTNFPKSPSPREQKQIPIAAPTATPTATPPAAPVAADARRAGRTRPEWSDEKSGVPSYVRKGNVLGHQKGRHAPGELDFIIDEEEFEMPTFIRRQAD